MSKKPTAQKEFNLGLTPKGFLILKFTTNEAGFPVTRLEYDSGELTAPATKVAGFLEQA